MKNANISIVSFDEKDVMTASGGVTFFKGSVQDALGAYTFNDIYDDIFKLPGSIKCVLYSNDSEITNAPSDYYILNSASYYDSYGEGGFEERIFKINADGTNQKPNGKELVDCSAILDWLNDQCGLQ